MQDITFKRDALQRDKSQRSLFLEGLDIMARNNIPLPDVDIDLYNWASHAVRTRCFQVNNTLDHVLVPFADMVNHDELSNTWWYGEDDIFIMRGGPYKIGDQVFASYGGDYSWVVSIRARMFIQ